MTKVVLILLYLWSVFSYGEITGLNPRVKLPVCSGKWVENDKNANNNLLGLKKSFAEYTNNEDILKDVCPVEIFNQNCYFNGITNRTNSIMKREWESDDEKCEKFEPKTFLESLRGRNMYLMGDSMMTELWNALICTLMFEIQNVDTHVVWYKWVGSDGVANVYNEKTCPMGKDHCTHGGNAYVTFKDYNASIAFIFIPKYSHNIVSKTFDAIKATSNDVVILNFGVHYNTEAEFTSVMKMFYENLDSYVNSDKGKNKPIMYFLETTPQHFPQMQRYKNGYYQVASAAEWCDVLTDLDDAYTLDFRNRVVDKILSDGKTGIKQIKVAQGLYTQFDAHIAGDSKLTPHAIADCTHWCIPSNVYPYMFRMIYNTIRGDLSNNAVTPSGEASSRVSVGSVAVSGTKKSAPKKTAPVKDTSDVWDENDTRMRS